MTTETIRRRPDGSIDTAYYVDRARQLRSETVFGSAGTRNRAKPHKTIEI